MQLRILICELNHVAEDLIQQIQIMKGFPVTEHSHLSSVPLHTNEGYQIFHLWQCVWAKMVHSFFSKIREKPNMQTIFQKCLQNYLISYCRGNWINKEELLTTLHKYVPVLNLRAYTYLATLCRAKVHKSLKCAACQQLITSHTPTCHS